MYIDMKKLSEYVCNGEILEFQTDQECMDFFNTYDFQNFETEEEMKVYQGKYGFSIGSKRYHINTESALDVYISESVHFTPEELQLLYVACISYGNKLAEIVKSIPNEENIVDELSGRAKDSWNLARKITEYLS